MIHPILNRINAGMVEKIGREVGEQFGGILRCETCHYQFPLVPTAAGRYLAHGWPKCCGYTMRWWTQRQLNAGEMK